MYNCVTLISVSTVSIYLYILAGILGRSRCHGKGSLKSKSNEVRIKSAKVKKTKDDRLNIDGE